MNTINEKKTIEVVAAVIRKDGRVFATQRGYGAYKDGWEFPGGKIEQGETREQALVREIHEELASDINVDSFIETVRCDYPEFHLVMHCFYCSLIAGSLTLKEHEASRWLAPQEINSVAWLEADKIIVERIVSEMER